MLDLDWATIAFEIVNFVVLSFLLYRFLLRPVMRRVQERTAEKEALLHEAQTQQQEAAALEDAWQARLADVEQQAAVILDRAQEEALQERQEMLQAAYMEAERMLQQTQIEAVHEQQRSVDDFHDEMLTTVLDVCAEVLTRVLPSEVHDRLVQELNDRIWHMGQHEMTHVEAVRQAIAARTPIAYITVAQPLSAAQQGQLARTLAALADRNVKLDVVLDEALLAGMKIRVGDLVVEHSIAGQLDQLRDRADTALPPHNDPWPAANSVEVNDYA